MKKIKSPINLILTFASILPLFIACLATKTSFLIPMIFLAILFALHMTFNRHSISDAANIESVQESAKAYNRIDNANVNVLSAGGGMAPNSFAIIHTVVQQDENYHGSWLCWGAVILSYLAGVIPMYDKIFPAPPADDLLFYYKGTPTGALSPFIPFFAAVALMAAADLSYHFSAKKSPKAAKIIMALFVSASMGVFCFALINLMKY